MFQSSAPSLIPKIYGDAGAGNAGSDDSWLYRKPKGCFLGLCENVQGVSPDCEAHSSCVSGRPVLLPAALRQWPLNPAETRADFSGLGSQTRCSAFWWLCWQIPFWQQPMPTKRIALWTRIFCQRVLLSSLWESKNDPQPSSWLQCCAAKKEGIFNPLAGARRLLDVTSLFARLMCSRKEFGTQASTIDIAGLYASGSWLVQHCTLYLSWYRSTKPRLLPRAKATWICSLVFCRLLNLQNFNKPTQGIRLESYTSKLSVSQCVSALQDTTIWLLKGERSPWGIKHRSHLFCLAPGGLKTS